MVYFVLLIITKDGTTRFLVPPEMVQNEAFSPTYLVPLTKKKKKQTTEPESNQSVDPTTC